MDINRILAELRAERERISQAITALELLNGARAENSTASGTRGTVLTQLASKPKQRRNRMSPAARKRMSEMMKKRWAERRKAKTK